MESFLYNFITFVVVIVSVIYLFFKFQFSYWRIRRVPYVEPTIPFGNLLWKTNLVYSLDRVYKNLKSKGPFVGSYFFFKPVALLTDLDLIKDIFIKDFSNFSNRGIFYNEKDDPLSAHLFSLDSEKWRKIRVKLTPTFTSGKMKFMFPTIVKVGHEFVATLSGMIQTENEIEIKELLARFTTDVIGTCAFGIECNSLKDPNVEFRVLGRKIFEDPRDGPFGRTFKSSFPNLAKRLGMKVINDDVSEFFLKVVRETVKYREENNIKRNDFMDMLIDLKNGRSEDEATLKLGKLTLEEIAAQVFLFFIGGFETTSSALAYSIYELAGNQEIQDKARAEIEEVLMKHDGQLSYEAISEMIYLDQVLSESLRKYPPVGFLLRSTKEDYYVSSIKETLEKGTMVLVPVYSIQHDKDLYADPEVFDPNRFTPEAINSRHPTSFLSFGEGPRNCIGLRFAKMQSRIGLAMLLKRFKFSFSPRTPRTIIFDATSLGLAAEGGMWINVERV